MTLNYEFINDVSKPVKDEIKRREGKYWPAGHINEDTLAWNYQKTAYLILTSVTVEPPPGFQLADKGAQAREAQFIKDGIRPDIARQRAVYNAVVATKIESTNAPGKVTPRSTMKNPSVPILDLYGPNYTNSDGVIKGAIINSAEISSDGTYGSILRTTVNFTVFDRSQLDLYIDDFLRPGRDIELEYGWTINENIAQNQGKIRGTVYNFNFSAKADGSWDCTLNALGPSTMTYGFGLDQQGTEALDNDWLSSPKGKSLSEIFKTIIDTTDTDITNAGDISINTSYDVCIKRNISDSFNLLANVVTNNSSNTVFPGFSDIYTYIFKLPGKVEYTWGARAGQVANAIVLSTIGIGQTIENIKKGVSAETAIKTGASQTEAISYKSSYITLRDLINLINLIITNSTKITIPQYTFNGFDINGLLQADDICLAKLDTYFKGVGSSQFGKFAFATQINGISAPRFDFNIGSSFTPPISRDGVSLVRLADLLLINVDYLYTTIQNILSNDTNLTGKKIVAFLSNIFNELNTCTGGWISLIIKDSPVNNITNKSEYLAIRNENYAPTKKELNLQPPLEFKAFTKGSIVRNLSVESSVPDAIQAEVATYTRAGSSYVGSGDTLDEANVTLAELHKALFTLNNDFMSNFNLDAAQQQSSLAKWQNEVQGIYRKMFAINQGQVLAGHGMSKYNIGNLSTAIFPIKLKVTLDGIEGFQYGNSITSNWLPAQYTDPKKSIYWTVIKIRHMIQNNDWSTELDTIYRINT